eukprot:TRINITY_DN5132_c0_g1_i2.p1 TRINITY_DN5132_c0_g1~~TRINITY_DN5132_c0_g1_i2.p1  ORF type:complete len:796 (-),score=169.31 TRINITY_DN5132_c0_g1_i2:6-2393(-)
MRATPLGFLAAACLLGVAGSPSCAGTSTVSGAGLLTSLAEDDGSYLLQTSMLKAGTFADAPASTSESFFVEMLAPETTTLRSHGSTANKTTEPFDPHSGSAIVGITMNGQGDLDAFYAGLATNVAVTVASYMVFLALRQLYPKIYQNNCEVIDRLQKPPFQLSGSFFAPLFASLKLGVDNIVEVAGLDHGMLIQFQHLVMNMMLLLGIPAAVLLVPLYWFAGGQVADNRLSYIGFANVPAGSWVCWVVACFVWYVVAAVQVQIFRAQQNTFMRRRENWLMQMPQPRANTVLLESIPADTRTDEKVRELFEEIFGEGCITEIAFVRDTSKLLRGIRHRENCRRNMHEAEFEWDSCGNVDEKQKEQLSTCLKEAEDNIENLRDQILKSGEVSASAFVTFKDQQQSILALNMRYTEDDEECIVSIPPDPADVRYADLQADLPEAAFRKTVGYGLIAGLFFGFIPLVTGITNMTRLDTMERIVIIRKFFEANPNIAALWSSLAGSLGLTIFMSFLPTFLVLIFDNFFLLKADAWLQLGIQQWYFYFLVIFVLLVTAVGTSLWESISDLVQEPMAVFSILATSLPSASHFYLNYVPLQWGGHAMNMMRYINLAKFVGFKKVVSEERAQKFAEPEDQDYFGMGSRSARHTLIAVIGMVFCTTTPLMTPLVFTNAALCRIMYGYLVVYAEGVKADLGGEFFVSQLWHLQQGLLIYILLMTGVLLERGSTYGPGMISASSLAMWLHFYRRFGHKFHTESLPIRELKVAKAMTNRAATRSSYLQPELMPHGSEDDHHSVKQTTR